jgi:putative polyhydroxyalkanoic acid system protein
VCEAEVAGEDQAAAAYRLAPHLERTDLPDYAEAVIDGRRIVVDVPMDALQASATCFPNASVSGQTASAVAGGRDEVAARMSNSGQVRPRQAVTVSVSENVTVVIGHRLGKAEAVSRLKEGFARTNGHLGGMIAMEQEAWQGDTVRFRMRALGQTAAGSIEVLEDALRIEVSLPWLLAKATKRLLPILHKETTLLLEKK